MSESTLDMRNLPQSPSEAEERRVRFTNAQKEQFDALQQSINNIAQNADGERFFEWLAQQCGYGVVIPPFGVQNGIVVDAQSLMVWNAARQDIWWQIRKHLLPSLREKLLNNL